MLVEMSMTDEEVVSWTESAMKYYCDFEESVVKITEKHENIIADFNVEAKA